MTPDQYDALYERAMVAFIEQQDIRLALQLSADCIRANPADTDAWVLRADIFYVHGKDWKAASCYAQAARTLTNPNTPNRFRNPTRRMK